MDDSANIKQLLSNSEIFSNESASQIDLDSFIQSFIQSYEEDGNKIRRPMNSFIFWSHLIRRKLLAENCDYMYNHSQLSKILGKKWGCMTPAEKLPFYKASKYIYNAHKVRYPNYKFCPKRIKTSEKLHTIVPKIRLKEPSSDLVICKVPNGFKESKPLFIPKGAQSVLLLKSKGKNVIYIKKKLGSRKKVPKTKYRPLKSKKPVTVQDETITSTNNEISNLDVLNHNFNWSVDDVDYPFVGKAPLVKNFNKYLESFNPHGLLDNDTDDNAGVGDFHFNGSNAFGNRGLQIGCACNFPNCYMSKVSEADPSCGEKLNVNSTLPQFNCGSQLQESLRNATSRYENDFSSIATAHSSTTLFDLAGRNFLESYESDLAQPSEISNFGSNCDGSNLNYINLNVNPGASVFNKFYNCDEQKIDDYRAMHAMPTLNNFNSLNCENSGNPDLYGADVNNNNINAFVDVNNYNYYDKYLLEPRIDKFSNVLQNDDFNSFIANSFLKSDVDKNLDLNSTKSDILFFAENDVNKLNFLTMYQSNSKALNVGYLDGVNIINNKLSNIKMINQHGIGANTNFGNKNFETNVAAKSKGSKKKKVPTATLR